MADFKRIGFGQVEPNHLSAQRTGQIYAQLHAHVKNADNTTDAEASKPTITQLENGQFVKYDYLRKEVNFAGAGEWMMVMNEVKLYDDRWRESYKDFAMLANNYTRAALEIDTAGDEPARVGEMVPRVFKTNIGDIYTTNCIGIAGVDGKTEVTYTEAAAPATYEGAIFTVNATTGYLKYNASPAATEMQWQCVAETTMPDGQAALKLMRIN